MEKVVYVLYFKIGGEGIKMIQGNFEVRLKIDLDPGALGRAIHITG